MCQYIANSGILSTEHDLKLPVGCSDPHTSQQFGKDQLWLPPVSLQQQENCQYFPSIKHKIMHGIKPRGKVMKCL